MFSAFSQAQASQTEPAISVPSGIRLLYSLNQAIKREGSGKKITAVKM
jgi:hypothetical protein